MRVKRYRGGIINRDQIVKYTALLTALLLGLLVLVGLPGSEPSTSLQEPESPSQEPVLDPLDYASLHPETESEIVSISVLPEEDSTTHHAVSLRILNSSKQSVSDATIELDGKETFTGKTDGMGDVHWAEIPADGYVLTVNHSGFPEKRIPFSIKEDVQEEIVLDSYTLQLVTFEKLSKEHVKKYAVYAKHAHSDTFETTPYQKELGSLIILGNNDTLTIPCEQGLYSELKIVAKGFEELIVSTREFEKSGTTLSGKAYLIPTGPKLKGIVIDENDQPIPDAWVFPNQPAATIHKASGSIKRSDSDGTFVLDPEFPQFKYVSASHPQFARGYTIVEDRYYHEGIQIVLKPGGSIHGTVRYQGEPLPKQEVYIRYFGDNGVGRWSTKTDKLGQYQFQELPEGQCTIHWNASTVYNKEEVITAVPETMLSAEYELEVGEELEHNFDLGGATGAVEVIFKQLDNVKDNYDHIEMIHLYALEENQRSTIEMEVDENGVAFKDEIPVGQWEVLVIGFHDDFGIVFRKIKAIIHSNRVSQVDVDLFYETGSVSGLITNIPNNEDAVVVLYGGTPKPLENRLEADVYRMFDGIIVPEDIMGVHFDLFGPGSKDGQQAFEILAVPPGKYTAVAIIETSKGDILKDLYNGKLKTLDYCTAEVEIRAGEHSEVHLEF